MLEILVAAAILGPVGLGLLGVLAWRAKLRNAVVVISAVLIAAAALALTIQRCLLGDWMHAVRILPGHAWMTAGTVMEFVVLAAFLAIGLRLRSALVVLLSLVQLGLAIAGEWTGHGRQLAETGLLIDPLALALVLVASLVGGAVLVFAVGYMRNHRHHAPATAAGDGQFFLTLIAFLGMMNGLVLADSLQWLSVFWELTTLCSFVLIGHDGTTEARAAAKRALIINSFGGAALMGGILLASQGASTGLEALMASKAMAPMALLCLAAMTKSAQLPFQSWLLGAMVAPTPVSALLHSATMVKAGSYLVLRLSPALAGTNLAHLLAVAGAFTFAAGSALAVSQSNAKKVLAYSTFSNLGLIVTCAAIATPLAYAAGLFILVFHAASKGLLFLCIGAIEQRIGSRDIEDMGRIMYLMPVTTAIAITGMVSMMLVPFGMLVGKFLAMESAVSSPLVLVLIIVGSALSVVFWAKMIGRIQTVSFHAEYKYEKLGPSMLTGLASLVLPVVVGGLVTMPLYSLLAKPVALHVFPTATAASLAAAEQIERVVTWPFYGCLVLAMAAGLLTLRRLRPEQIRPPFLCGENMSGTSLSYNFHSLMDAGETAWLGSYYLRSALGEKRLTFWFNLLAGLIILTMLGLLGVI